MVLDALTFVAFLFFVMYSAVFMTEFVRQGAVGWRYRLSFGFRFLCCAVLAWACGKGYF